MDSGLEHEHEHELLSWLYGDVLQPPEENQSEPKQTDEQVVLSSNNSTLAVKPTHMEVALTELQLSETYTSARICIEAAQSNYFISVHGQRKGLSPEKEQSLRHLYESLDVDCDGAIDVRDLTDALKQHPHIPVSMAPVLFSRFKSDDQNQITFAEFAQYFIEHEKNLEIMFHDLDRNGDGVIDVKEMKKYCDDLGLPVPDEAAQKIVERMARVGSASVSLSNFKDFMLLYPHSKPEEVARFWKHNLVIDIGEDSQVPEDWSQQEIESGFWWKHLVAGAVAGCVSRTCTAPLDRVKIYLQVHATRSNGLRVLKAVRLLFEEGGLKSFWRGNGINVTKIAPESAVKFMSYDIAKRLILKFREGDHELRLAERLIAGSCAGVISQSIIYPLEVLKTRLALRRSGELNEGLLHFAAKMCRNEGLRCFYKGNVPNFIGIIPYAGIDLAVYETLKAHYFNHYPSNPIGDVMALPVCGACSSICGMFASYPFALIRTRLQARTVSGNPFQPDTMSGQMGNIWQNEGIMGFYRGIIPNLMKAVPAVAISYYVYEHVRTWLGAPMT